MPTNAHFRKRTILVLFLLFCAFISCTPTTPQWEISTITAHSPPIKYTRAVFNTCNTFKGLETEFIFLNTDTTLYLNISSLQFPEASENGYLEINVTIDGQAYSCWAERLQGGQRLLLSDDSQQLILSSLLNDACIEISVGRYQTTLLRDNFCLPQ